MDGTRIVLNFRNILAIGIFLFIYLRIEISSVGDSNYKTERKKKREVEKRKLNPRDIFVKPCLKIYWKETELMLNEAGVHVASFS